MGELPTLWNVQKLLAPKKYVDLTHDFPPGFRVARVSGRNAKDDLLGRPDTLGSGFFSELFTHAGQWGTHVDPPARFVKGLRTVDQIDPKEMILSLVVIDVHEECANKADDTLSLERVKN